jgi:ATP-binding cassette subfamily B protein
MVYLVRLASFQASVSLNTVAAIRRTVTATRNYLWLGDHATEQGAAGAGTSELPPAGALQFRDVTFRYPGASADALSGVSIDVPAGSTLAIVGDNGAGKTTLVKLLARFYEPTEGTVTLNDIDIGSIDMAAWRAGLTACLQDFSRFEFLVRETVGIGRLAAIEDVAAVHGAIDAAGAEDVVAGLASGVETQLGTSWDGGADLSTGQWQKLALGRAMMRTLPRILLLDEPTAALDAIAEARLFERYAAASEFARATGAITIIVSHRMSTVRMADRIAVIEQGRVRQYGSHETLVGVEGPYRELFATQAAAYAQR